MIAVTGATGALGKLVIKHLLEKTNAEHITAIVRDRSKAMALQHQGIEVRVADYTKPKDFEEALSGVKTLLLISSNAIGERVPQHKTVVDAANNAKVETLVYTSVLKATENPMILAKEHQPTEAYLQRSGINYVILRNGWYTENYSAGVADIIQNGAIFSAAGKGKLYTAERNDYALAAANVLVAPARHHGRIYELAGDTGWTMEEFANTLEELTGKSINLNLQSEAQQIQHLVGAGLPEGFAHALADSERYAAEGWLEEKSGTLSKLIGRATVPLAKTLKKN